jgi:trans-aconitate methyltransferase
MNEYYESIKQHFESDSKPNQRGRTSEESLFAYAAHVLERLNPPRSAVLLDIGCGDGLPMRKMKEIRPDLNIDGLDLSSTLSDLARVNNPDSIIFTGNILEIDVNKKYDAVFSFSFLQYIPFSDIFPLTKKLASIVFEGGISYIYRFQTKG